MSGGVLHAVAHMQQARLLANYERPGALERQASPYSAFGQAAAPFDLNGQATIELKKALVALAALGSDPSRNADPITERLWQKIMVDGPYADAWEGPAADELVTAIGRYAPSSGVAGPYTFLRASATGRYGINGGPQPTAAGLEVINKALAERLGGNPAMLKYAQWRGWWAPSDNAQVLPNTKTGPFWQKDGYTTANESAGTEIVELVNRADDWLIKCWQLQETLGSEAERAANLDNCILAARSERDAAARLANQSVQPPACAPGDEWDYTAGTCVTPSGVIHLPEVTPTDEMCIDAYVSQGKSKSEARRLCGVEPESILAGMGLPIVLGVALGGGLWWWQNRRSER